MRRDLALLERGSFDLLVIGGGILGACAAWDAAQRGLAVALLERDDFAAGNSSNNLKIVHGGLRLLQRLAFTHVSRTARERTTWLRIAPHLVEPLPVLVPAYGPGTHRALLLRAAAIANNLITWTRNRDLPADRLLPRARGLSRRECVDLVPELGGNGVTGGLLFYDARMYNSERVVLELIQAAHAAGAAVANHVEVMAPLVHRDRLVGVVAHDRLQGGLLTIRARVLVNAAGAAVPDIARRFLGPTAARDLPHAVALNIITRALGHRVAFGVPSTAPHAAGFGGRRQLFLVPWRDRTLIGTAHLPPEGDPTDPAALRRYVTRFLEELKDTPIGPIGESDVIGVHRGLVPSAGERTSSPRLLAWHRIIDHQRDGRPELISALSAKFTTGRLAAEEVVNLAVRKLGRPATRCRTAITPLPGAPEQPVSEALTAAQQRYGASVAADVIEHVVRTYGTRHTRILDRVGAPPDWGERVHPDATVLKAQLRHAVEHEMAYTVDDLLWRRTELGPRGLVTEAVRAVARAVLQNGV